MSHEWLILLWEISCLYAHLPNIHFGDSLAEMVEEEEALEMEEAVKKTDDEARAVLPQPEVEQQKDCVSALPITIVLQVPSVCHSFNKLHKIS